MARILLRGGLVATVCALVLVLSAAANAESKIAYPLSPGWTSADHDVATGCGFGDLNRDGWPDLVVANGNDIHREHVIVYYNQGGGAFPVSPDWASGDIDYHGHLAIGDVNGDGWLDVAVAVFLGPAGFSEEGYAKLYLNDGAGTLESQPSWRSQDTFFTFSVALGDADGDGDLDLAAAAGEAYYNPPDRNRIYFNNGGALDVLPGWLSNESDHTMDIAFGDLNSDGALDLVACNASAPMRAYYSVGGSIQTAAGWSAAGPTNKNGNSVALGDINLDGYLDIVYSNNTQLNGTGRYHAHLSDGAGGLGINPGWESEWVGYTSSVVLCDVQGDGLLDVVGGEWWGQIRMYLNEGGTVHKFSDFVSSTSSVVEATPVSDVDLVGLRAVEGEAKAVDGAKKVFYFEKTPVMSIERVVADGAAVPATAYSFDPEAGWLSLAQAPQASLVLDYTSSASPDFAVSNWDDDKGNYLFYHLAMTVTATPPPITDIPRGTSFDVGETYVNYTGFSPKVKVWSRAGLPSGDWHTFWTLERQFPAFKIFDRVKVYHIPAGAPLGTYELLLLLARNGVEVDRDSFPFQVVN